MGKAHEELRKTEGRPCSPFLGGFMVEDWTDERVGVLQRLLLHSFVIEMENNNSGRREA